jgi:poly-gamma-glutamate synthesis protein (capsule biosynthesis protein)
MPDCCKVSFRNRFPRRSAILLTLVACVVGPSLAQADEKSGTVRIIVAGDVMLDGGPGHTISKGLDPFSDVAALLADADLAVCNLECAVTNCSARIEKTYNFQAKPPVIPMLKKYFSAVCLANNHAIDYTHKGFLEELSLLEKAGLPYFGGGHDVKEARRPLILERNGLRVALLGYNNYPPEEYEAKADAPGIAWLKEPDLLADIKAAREVQHADVVLPLLHWGNEMEPAPDASQKALARKLLDGGADAVVGSHPHVTQTVDLYKGRPIVYSLGNFVFDYYPEDPPVWTGWIVRLTFSKTAPVELETFAVELDAAGIPHLVPSTPGKAEK